MSSYFIHAHDLNEDEKEWRIQGQNERVSNFLNKKLLLTSNVTNDAAGLLASFSRALRK